MQRFLTITIVLIILLIQACERIDSNLCHQMGRESQRLTVNTIGEISNDSIEIWLDATDTVLFYEPVFLRIDDQATFDNLVNCNYDDIQLNFKDYTLLIGYFFDSYDKSEVIEHRFSLHCGYRDQSAGYLVIFEITMENADFKPIHFNALVEKMHEDLPIGVTVSVTENEDVPN